MSAPGDNQLDHIRIVLCAPSHAGNIGAVARAMRCMGLSRLVLVAPAADHLGPEARARASRADAVLEAAVISPDLASAVADCHLVVGTSSRARTVEAEVLDARRACEAVAARPADQAAVVFGTERSGLTNEQLAQCHLRTYIPTAPDYRSLNLAAAVQVVAWELRMAHEVSGPGRPPSAGAEVTPSTARELAAFFDHLWQALEAIRFLRPELETAQRVKERLHRMYSRARPDVAELRLLRGIQARTLQAASRGPGPDAPAEPDEPDENHHV